MRTGAIVGVEALARWETPRRGTVAPDEFVPSVERSDVTIQALTEWTLYAAFTQARAWQSEGHDLAVAVNLSPKSILDAGLPGQVSAMLESVGLMPSLV